MQWRKATNFKFQDRQIYFGRRTFTNEVGDNIVKGSGSFSDGAFFWKGLNEPPVGEKYYHELEILDESPPASAEEEAATMYPDLAGEPYDLINKVQQEKRQAHINCAGMYTGEIQRLKTLIKDLYESEVAEPCRNAGATNDLIESHWQEFKAKHNL